MRRRIAFIDYFPTHYRQRLYEEIGRQMEADFYFFSDERERWHNKAISAVRQGDYRNVELRRYRIGRQAFMPGIALRLSANRYDAVIKNLNGKIMLPLTYGTARARSVPFVLWTGMWHHPQTRAHAVSRPLTEAIYRNADSIVVYGDHVRRFLEDVPGVASEKIFTAGQAVMPERFEAVTPEPNPDKPEVVFVGQFKEYKGVSYLIDAFERLNGHNARLLLVGNGPLESELRARIGDRPDIEIVGHVPQDRLPGVLARASFMVLPSVTTAEDREPWGLVTNEAMHAGLPVVASTAVGAAAHGLVQDGRNGFVVPERDADALAGAIRKLLADPALAKRLGEQAREDVQAYNYAGMGEAFTNAVEHAVQVRAAVR